MLDEGQVDPAPSRRGWDTDEMGVCLSSRQSEWRDGGEAEVAKLCQAIGVHVAEDDVIAAGLESLAGREAHDARADHRETKLAPICGGVEADAVD